jgi:zinc protease
MPSVYSVWAQYLTPREPGYLIVTAVCDPAVADTVRGRILHEIRILRQDPVTAAELARAKEVFVAQRAFSQEGATDSAFLIGFWSVMKNAGFEDTYLRHIQSVQSNGIQEVARRYLNNNNSISIILLPERS